MQKLFLLLFIAIISLPLSAQDKDPQADIDWSKYDFSSHFTLKNGGGRGRFGENKRLFISNFQVVQMTTVSGKSTGVSNLAKMTVSMEKIDLVKYQAIVDKLYIQFKERLISEGYTIVSDEEVANSDFAKKEHNGKSIWCTYVNQAVPWADGNGNEFVNLIPTNKFIVANTNAILGTWPTKFGKSIDANVVSVIMTICPASFDGSRGMGKKGASIEAQPNMLVTPNCSASNDRGGFGVWSTMVDGKANWVGPNGMSKLDSNTDVFGSVRGTFVIDVNEDVYLSEVEALASGVSMGYINALMKEIK